MPVGISERLMSWHIPLTKTANSQYATLISAYAPTLDSGEDIKDSFHDFLDSTTRAVPVNNILILLGDFIIRVGRDYDLWPGIIDRHGAGNMNRNGLRLQSLCSEHNLTITNTIFQMKNKYKSSWMHP